MAAARRKLTPSDVEMVSEAKGRSLEEIQERWVLNGDRMLDEEPAA